MSKTIRIKAPQKKLKSMDLSQGAIFKMKPKQNAYIRGKRFQKLRAAQMKGTNAEIY